MDDSEMVTMQPRRPYTDESIAGAGDESINLTELFRTLRRGRTTIFLSSFIVMAISTIFAFLLPFRYTSTATFIPPNLSNTSSLASAIGGQLSALGGGDLLGGVKTTGELYSGILKSRSIAAALVKRFDLMKVFNAKRESEAEAELGSNTVVSVDAKSSIVTLAVTAKSPELAHDLTAAYLEVLRDKNGQMALSQSSQRRLFFSQQLEKEKNELADAEVDLKRTEEQSGLIAPGGQTESEIRTIAETQAQVAAREVQLAALRQSATEENPQIIRLRSEIADLQGQLSRLQKGNGNASMAGIPTSKVPAIKLEYIRKERDVKYHEALFEILSKQYEAARLDESRDAPMLQVLDEANYPDTKSSPKRSYYMLGGLFCGLLGSSIWVLTRDRLRALEPSEA